MCRVADAESHACRESLDQIHVIGAQPINLAHSAFSDNESKRVYNETDGLTVSKNEKSVKLGGPKMKVAIVCKESKSECFTRGRE